MPATCTPEALAEAAKCFECLDEKSQLGIQTYLLAVIAGGSTDPNVLAAAAKKFQGVSDRGLLAIQDYLLCQLVNA